MSNVSRSKAREIALQLLYQQDQNPDIRERYEAERIEDELPKEKFASFTRMLLIGVRENLENIDNRINKAAANWDLERMGICERNILRLATFELILTDTPAPVVLNEAIELAKLYGTADASAFVNGVLDNIAKNL